MKRHTLKQLTTVIFFIFFSFALKAWDGVFIFPQALTASVIYGACEFNLQTLPPDSLLTLKQTNASCFSMPIQENIYMIGCQNSGFSGYFGIENWEFKNIGDDGVDVTGAPNGLLINTIGQPPGKENPRNEWQFKIVIPSEGYVYLDLEKIGGSIFTMQYTINEETPHLMYKHDQKINTPFTTLLHRNDVLEIKLSFDARKNNAFLLKDFNFFSNTEKIRQTTTLNYRFAYSVPTFFTSRSIESKPILGIENIVLPVDVKVKVGQTKPRYTGYPIVDMDGLLSTKEDQFRLNNTINPFKLSWKDTTFQDENANTIIEREWVVTDHCKGNVLTATQQIFVEATPPLGDQQKVEKESVISKALPR